MNEVQFTSISIDNSIFKSYKYNFEDGMLKHLSQFRNHVIEFVIPNIIWGEMNNHLLTETTEAVKKVKELNENVIAKNYIPHLKEKGSQLLKDDFIFPEILAKQRLKLFKDTTGLKLLDESKYLQLDELIKGYFENKAPFESKEKKKYEFPDAIALYALENYAKKNDKYILLVSVDEGWINFCKTSKNLYCEKKISEAFDRLNQQKSVDIDPIKTYVNEVIEKIKNDSDDKYLDFENLDEFIKNYQFDFSFYPHHFEVERWSEIIETNDFSINNVDLLEINLIDNTFTINIEVNFSLYVSVDFDFYAYYSLEDSYLENRVEDLQYDEKINVLYTIKMDQDLNPENCEVVEFEYDYSSGSLEVGIVEYY